MNSHLQLLEQSKQPAAYFGPLFVTRKTDYDKYAPELAKAQQSLQNPDLSPGDKRKLNGYITNTTAYLKDLDKKLCTPLKRYIRNPKKFESDRASLKKLTADRKAAKQQTATAAPDPASDPAPSAVPIAEPKPAAAQPQPQPQPKATAAATPEPNKAASGAKMIPMNKDAAAKKENTMFAIAASAVLLLFGGVALWKAFKN